MKKRKLSLQNLAYNVFLKNYVKMGVSLEPLLLLSLVVISVTKGDMRTTAKYINEH